MTTYRLVGAVKQVSSPFVRYGQPLLLVVVAPLLFALLSYIYMGRLNVLLQEEMQRNITNLAQQSVSIIEARLEGRLSVLETLAAHPRIMDESVSVEQKLDLLRNDVRHRSHVRMGLVKPDGQAHTTDSQTFSAHDRTYFQESLSGKPHVSEVIVSRLDKYPVVVHSMPIHNADGDVSGVIYATEQAAALAEQLNVRFSYADTGSSFLMDGKGTLLVAPNSVDNNFYTRLARENPPDVVALFRRNMQLPYSDMISMVYQGQKVFATSLRVPGSSGWHLVFMVPESAATAPMRPLLTLTISALLGIVLVLMGTGFYILALRKGYLRQRGFAEAAIHSAGMYQLQVDHKGNILSCNDLFRRRMGFGPTQALPNLSQLSHLTHQRDPALEQQRGVMEKSLSRHEPFAQKLRGQGDDVLYVQWHVLPAHRSDAVTLLGTDFSAQEQTAASQRNAALLRDMQSVFDNIPFPMAVRGTDNKLLLANHSLVLLAGKDLVHSEDVRFGGRVPTDEVRRLNAALLEAVQSKTKVATLHSATLPDGTVHHYENVQTPLLDEQGVVTSVVSISVDVTESLQAQEYLTQEVQRLRDLLDTSPVGVIIAQQGVVRFRNLRARQMVGLDVGSYVRDVPLTEGDPDAVLHALETKPVIRDLPFSLYDPRKRLRHMLLTASQTMLEGERATLVWAVDVTALKDVESQLIQARDAAEAATRAKSDFLATMSHEIRTPMNAVLGFLHLFDRNNLTPRQLDYLEKITVSATGLLRIINDILDFSKIEAGKLEIECQSFDVYACVDAAQSIMGFSAREKGLDLQVRVADNVPGTVCGDRQRLSQVLINLLNNAVKFTPEGSVTLEVALHQPSPALPDAGSVDLLFSITDTGIGMDEEQISRIFQPFAQADTSTSRRFGGTGLGLVISRRLVQLMGGDIEVTSTPGQGTTFRFFVRLGSGHRQEADLPQAQAAQVDCDHWRDMRVLVVEDNEINQEIAGEMLRQLGFVVDFANDGLQSLDKVEEQEYVLIFMDMQMPGMDGLEATRRIRLKGAVRPELKSLPIVAMTANAMLDDRRRCLLAGMDDHLSKPIEPLELRKILIKWLPEAQE